MNKLITKLIVAIDNSHVAKSVLAIVFVLGFVVVSYKLNGILKYWLD